MRAGSPFGGIICFPALSAKPDLSTVVRQAPSAANFLQRFSTLYRTELLCRFDPAEGCKPPLIPHDGEHQTFTTLRQGPCDILRAPSWPKPREKGCFRICTDRSFALQTNPDLNRRPTAYEAVALPLSYSYIPNDVRGQAFRALLDTKCATPSCPSPNRGYQTIIPDGVP